MIFLLSDSFFSNNFHQLDIKKYLIAGQWWTMMRLFCFQPFCPWGKTFRKLTLSNTFDVIKHFCFHLSSQENWNKSKSKLTLSNTFVSYLFIHTGKNFWKSLSKLRARQKVISVSDSNFCHLKLLWKKEEEIINKVGGCVTLSWAVKEWFFLQIIGMLDNNHSKLTLSLMIDFSWTYPIFSSPLFAFIKSQILPFT